MSILTGKEALIALANGEEVELQATGDMNWYDSTQWTVRELLCFKGRFRLKPRAIAINGIEVPAPFEPKEGDKYYYIDSNRKICYGWDNNDCETMDENRVAFGVWRTEEEIKQVVAALRQVLGGAQ